MVEYIEREAAIFAVCQEEQNAHYKGIGGIVTTVFAVDVKNRINSIPAANVQPVPEHGRLIDAEALKAALVFAKDTAGWTVSALRTVLMVIDGMPTIPADKEDHT